MHGHETVQEHEGLRRLAWVVVLAAALYVFLTLSTPLASPAAAQAEVCPSGTAYLLPPGKDQCRPVCEVPAVALTAAGTGLGSGTFAATAKNPYEPAAYDFKGDIECAVPNGTNAWNVKKFCAQNAAFHCIHWHTYLAPAIGSPIPATALVTATADVGSSFVGWSPNCAPSQKIAVPRTDCSILMDTPKNVEATFALGDDMTPPTAPTLAVERLTSHSVKLTFTGADDDAWLGGFEIYRNGVLYTPRPRASGTTTTVTLDNQLCKTTYDWQVRAFDSQNESPSNTVSVFMGNTCVASKPPNTVFHLCAVGKYASCSAKVRTTRSRSAFFHWGARRNGVEIPYSKFKSQCRLDAKPWKACSPGKTYRRLHPGRHKVRIRAFDAAGKDQTPVIYRWIIRSRSGQATSNIPALAGRSTRNVVPTPSVLSSETAPSWASEIAWTMTRPSPVP